VAAPPPHYEKPSQLSSSVRPWRVKSYAEGRTPVNILSRGTLFALAGSVLACREPRLQATRGGREELLRSDVKPDLFAPRLTLNLPLEPTKQYLAAGDTLTASASICAYRGDVGICDDLAAPKELTTRVRFAWQTSDSDVVAVTSAGQLSAKHPGQATLSAQPDSASLEMINGTGVRFHPREASIQLTVVPTVSTLAWEPAARTLHAGDTLRLTAVGRDAHGRLVVRVPLGAVEMPPGGALDVAGWDDTTGVRISGDVGESIVLLAAIGSRTAEAEVRAVSRRP
jgi:hypothetical protein